MLVLAILEKHCLNCNKLFKPKYSKQKFCSHECYWNYNKGKKRPKSGKVITCKRCGKKFYVPPSELKRNRKFCSSECANPKLPRITRKCIYCQKEFVVHIHSKKKFCSRECYYKYRTKNLELNTGKVVKCDFCGKPIYIQPHEFKFKKHFCSRKCHISYMKTNLTGKYVKCLVCGKKFYTEKNSRRRFCSFKCSRIGIQKIHAEEIKKQAKILTKQGYKCVLPDFQPRPDIIAIKNNKVYAVEIEFGIPKVEKYNNTNIYDDIWWIIMGRGQDNNVKS